MTPVEGVVVGSDGGIRFDGSLSDRLPDAPCEHRMDGNCGGRLRQVSFHYAQGSAIKFRCLEHALSPALVAGRLTWPDRLPR